MENAVPKVILKMMNVDGMTRENVASHLQKYRLHLKHQAGSQSSRADAQRPMQPLQLAQLGRCMPALSAGGTAEGIPIPMPTSLPNVSVASTEGTDRLIGSCLYEAVMMCSTCASVWG